MCIRDRKSIAELSVQSETGDFGKAVREFRRFSAQLRAGAVRAESQPKQAGSLPAWRFARPYFNGGAGAFEAANTAEKGGAVEYKELPPAPRAKRGTETKD